MPNATYGLRALEALDSEYEDCQLCPALCRSRQAPVFGQGKVAAPILIIGDAPGEEEDADGMPFIGPSGRRLMDLLRLAWPQTEELVALDDLWDSRSEDNARYWDALRDYFDNYIFWTNIVMCRPTDSEGKNRQPAPQETKNCRSRLVRTIYAVDPLLIIAVGKPAASALVGKVVQITKQRGEVYDISIPSPVTGDPVRYPCLAILDPTHLLRRGDAGLMKLKKGETYETHKDLEWAIQALLMPQYRAMYGTEFPELPDKV